jgi:protein TonB
VSKRLCQLDWWPSLMGGPGLPGRTGVSITVVFTLTLWLGCLGVGVLGFALPYVRPSPQPKEPPPVLAEILQVELTGDFLPEPLPVPADPAQPPPLLDLLVVPQPPPLIAVAKPSPAIAFPVPVERPVRIVEARQASPSFAKDIGAAPAPPVQAITYGHGEGKQPAPEYPPQAVREGQEGAVTLRFSVGENGRVLQADAVTASPWPLLNEAALRAVLERWRFRPGSIRLYEVSIRFELKE